ncbi:hypothetical protein QQ008_01970 [Fulvivirgaceae bacterium BMA10]|uniref:Lipoprotein n=1 Tax=Splendidivirga corallicola TaxID=3051826 RepID=A0ABT8KIL5_9BACT|nr:hypothetical protein [Fulvivirgaceae bacterium BMA10]
MKNRIMIPGLMKNAMFMLAAFLMIGLAACDKEEGIITDDLSIETDLTSQEETVDSYFDETDDIAFEANTKIDNGAINGRSGLDNSDEITRCAEITHDEENKTITIDFGDGCVGPGGVERSGKIIITYTDRKYVPGAVWVYTLENYTVNGIALEGTKTLTNVSESLDDYLSFNKVLEGGKATWPDGAVATREVNKTFTWVREAHPINDEFWVEGEASGTTKEGVAYSVEILSKMIYKRKCRRQGIHIAVQGIKSIKKDGQPDVLVDFGDGECDSLVTITKEGESIVVDLKEERKKRRLKA